MIQIHMALIDVQHTYTVDPINYFVRTEQTVAQSEIECPSIRSKVSANQELNFVLTGTKCRPIRNRISLP